MQSADEDFIDQIVNKCLNNDDSAKGRLTPTSFGGGGGGGSLGASHRSMASNHITTTTPPEIGVPPTTTTSHYEDLNGTLLNRSSGGASGRAPSFTSPSPNQPSRLSGNGDGSSHQLRGGVDWGPEEHVGANSRAQEFHGSPNPHRGNSSHNNPSHPLSATDNTVRRIQLWDERKRTRQMIQQHERMERELEECTFRPNTTMARTSIHLKKNIPASKAPGSATRGLTAQNLRMAGSSSGGGGGATFNPDDQEVYAAQAKAQDLMAPSALYANNEAWGFSNFVNRQLYAREKKQEEQAAAEAVFALKHPNVIRREPTVPVPFDLGRSVHKGTIKSIHTKPSEQVAKKVRSANSKSFYAERGVDGRIGTSPGGGCGVGSPYHTQQGRYGNDYSGYGGGGSCSDSGYLSPDESSFYDPVHSRNFRGVDGDNGDDLDATDVVAPSIPSGMFSMQASAIFASKAGIVRGGNLLDNNNPPFSSSSRGGGGGGVRGNGGGSASRPSQSGYSYY